MQRDPLHRIQLPPWIDGLLSAVGGIAQRAQHGAHHLQGEIGQRLQHALRRPPALQHRALLEELYSERPRWQKGARFQLGAPQRAQPEAPLFASISISGTANNICDLALTSEQMGPALEGVPVWTVTNEENEFILVSQDTQTNGRQLGLFCFNETDANLMLQKVQSKEFGIKNARVVPVTLDKVVELITAENPQAAGVAFRLVPDPHEIYAALELIQAQGRSLDRFAGVPVFAAEGLTIQSDKRTHIPLFLSKRDLDLAVGSAAKGLDGDDKAPGVEIASLENVLLMMENSPAESHWRDVVLIPSVQSRRSLLAMVEENQ